MITALASKYTATVPSARRSAAGNRPGSSSAVTAVGEGRARTQRNQAEHVERTMAHRSPRRARRTASRPTARPAWPARTGSTARRALQPGGADSMPRYGRPSPARTPAVPATQPIQKRRCMSLSSALSPLDSVACSGSRAMPHFGQLPGSDLAYLRMHRAGVDRAGGRQAARGRRLAQPPRVHNSWRGVWASFMLRPRPVPAGSGIRKRAHDRGRRQPGWPGHRERAAARQCVR